MFHSLGSFALDDSVLISNILADTKSMVVAGLTALSSTDYDLRTAITGKQTMRVLCIGHGGGSLPLFLASKIQGRVAFPPSILVLGNPSNVKMFRN